MGTNENSNARNFTVESEIASKKEGIRSKY